MKKFSNVYEMFEAIVKVMRDYPFAKLNSCDGIEAASFGYCCDLGEGSNDDYWTAIIPCAQFHTSIHNDERAGMLVPFFSSVGGREALIKILTARKLPWELTAEQVLKMYTDAYDDLYKAKQAINEAKSKLTI